MLALTSPTSGGRSVGIVRLLTKATEFVCLFVLSVGVYVCVSVCMWGVCVRVGLCKCFLAKIPTKYPHFQDDEKNLTDDMFLQMYQTTEILKCFQN
jgi:hypothetical protein